MSIKNSVYHGFFSYTPGVICVTFPGCEAARKRCEISRTKRSRKGAKLADYGLNGVQKFIDQQMGQRLLDCHRHTDTSSKVPGRWH